MYNETGGLVNSTVRQCGKYSVGVNEMNIQVERDTEGYLVNPDEWTDQIAIELANEEDIELNESHWQILRFIRDYYSEHNVVPDVRHVEDYLATENKIA